MDRQVHCDSDTALLPFVSEKVLYHHPQNQPPKDTVTLICKKLGRQHSQQSKVFWSKDKQ